MPHKPPDSNPLKRKDSDHENEQSSSYDDEKSSIPPPSKQPKRFSPSSPSTTPLVSSTSANTTNTAMNSSNANGGGDADNANLFQEMNQIDGELTSLEDQFSIRADNKYFVDHHEMVDEFIENVHHFLSVVNRQRKLVAFGQLIDDTLSHMLKFVGTRYLIRNCQWVSKMWREQVLKQELRVELVGFNPLKIESLLKSEFIGRVVSLRLIKVSDELLALLAHHFSSLSKLQHLDLEGNTLGNSGAELLKRFSLKL